MNEITEKRIENMERHLADIASAARLFTMMVVLFVVSAIAEVLHLNKLL
jgi:hypothetical protein